MTWSATLAFLHHAAAFLIVAALTVELVLIKAELTLTTARSVLRIDALYGLAAMAVLVVGFLRVFHTEKGSAYYFGSAPFWIKVGLFAIVGLVSIYPTRQFLAWRRDLAQDRAPLIADGVRRRIRMLIHVELALMVVILLCAALMARGIGFIS